MKKTTNRTAHKSTSHSQRLVLESRLVFDGAVAATVDEIQPDTIDNAVADNTANEPPVDFTADNNPLIVDVQPTADATAHHDLLTVTDLAVSPVTDVGSNSTATTLIVVDTRADGAADLLAKPPENAQIIAVDGRQNAFKLVSDTLQNRHDITTIDILTFDKGDNSQWLGNKALTNSLDSATSNELTHWGDSFTDNATITFHGANKPSTSWLSHIDALTGADVNWSQDSIQTSAPQTTSLFVSHDVPSSYADSLHAAESLTQKTLTQWFQKDDVLSQLAIPFSANANTPEWTANATALRDSIVNGTYNIHLEVRSSAELNGLLGAYSDGGTTNQPTLYINADYLATATPEQVQSILLEELGHSFDTVLNNGADSQGDEGHAFVALVLYNDANLKVNLQDNDHGILNMDAQQVAIEAAGSYAIAQTTFVPMSEADIQTSLKSISTAVTGNIKTTISIASTSNGTVVVYDQWEDGYEIDIKNPIQASTIIWGDGIVSPNETYLTGLTGDQFNSGKSIILTNDVNPALPLTMDFDGRDKIGSTKAIAVSRTGYSITPGSVLAGAVNVIDSSNAGKNYIIPIGGTNLAYAGTGINANSQLFEYTSAHIIATADNTVVSIDKTGDGVIDATVTLNQGQTYLVNGGITAGGTITATKGIGVYLIAGDVGSAYESRWFALNPKEQWASSYYAPVATVLDIESAHVFLYNPDASAITVTYDSLNASGVKVTNTVNVAAKSSQAVLMPHSAAHFYTADNKPFYAVGTSDSTAGKSSIHDWSYSLVPESYLTDKFVVAYGLGNANAPPSTAANGNPVWVTAAADTILKVDYKGDGVTIVDVPIKALQSIRLRDTDNDQTGLTVYTTDGTLITAAWGEDPTVAGAGLPYLDMGTTVLPFPDYILRKVSKEATNTVTYPTASNENGAIQLGEQVEYTISVTNRAVIDLFI
jgi:hypothetical protein